jgi:hypothetical protein
MSKPIALAPALAAVAFALVSLVHVRDARA